MIAAWVITSSSWNAAAGKIQVRSERTTSPSRTPRNRTSTANTLHCGSTQLVRFCKAAVATQASTLATATTRSTQPPRHQA